MQGGLLALDLAKVTGWAYAEPGARPAPPPLECASRGADGRSPDRETTCHTSDRHVSGAERLGFVGCETDAAFRALDRLLSDLVTLHAPSVAVFEAPWVGGNTHQNTAYMLFGLAAVSELVLAKREVRCFRMNNAGVRKHFIGVGRGTRKDLKRRTLQRCAEIGWKPKDDNEADALALLDAALATPKLVRLMRPTVSASVSAPGLAAATVGF